MTKAEIGDTAAQLAVDYELAHGCHRHNIGGDDARGRRGMGGASRPHTAMLSYPGSLKFFIAVEACDMRRSFNGLQDAVINSLKEEPKSGSLFSFTNKRHSFFKILYRDGSGLWVRWTDSRVVAFWRHLNFSYITSALKP